MRALLLTLAACALGQGAAHATPGTFLIVEGGVGPGFGDAFPEAPGGMAGGLTLGAGGKPKGWPLRFYGVMHLDWGSYEGTIDGANERATISRDTFGWSAGLRIVAPVYDRLRFIAETTLGGYSVDTEGVLGGGAEHLQTEDASFLVAFAAGLQWRFNLGFALGARCDIAIPTGLDVFDPVTEAIGVSTQSGGVANYGFSLTATFHL